LSPWFYTLWYGGAAVATLLAWRWSRRIQSPRRGLALVLAVLALGFTTVPLMSPDGGVWIPMAIYYLTLQAEAWVKATILIGLVWVLLFGCALVLMALRGRGSSPNTTTN